MNLHGLVRGAIGAVNPDIKVRFLRSIGATSNSAARRVPQYSGMRTVNAQVQPLSSRELRHLQSQNIQGVMRSVYLYGDVEGVVRVNQRGGDLLQFPIVPGDEILDWRVVEVFETWPDWCRVAVCLQ